MYGCSSGGVPASALVINSSNTSLGGSGSDMVEGDFLLWRFTNTRRRERVAL